MNELVCLETSFIIDFLRGKDVARNVLLELKENEEFICVASPTIMEFVKGAHLKGNFQKEIDNIEKFLSSVFVLDFDKKSAFLAGEISRILENTGEEIGIMDIMIGAIALQNNESLLTRNVKHFEKIKGLKTISY